MNDPITLTNGALNSFITATIVSVTLAQVWYAEVKLDMRLSFIRFLIYSAAIGYTITVGASNFYKSLALYLFGAPWPMHAWVYIAYTFAIVFSLAETIKPRRTYVVVSYYLTKLIILITAFTAFFIGWGIWLKV